MAKTREQDRSNKRSNKKRKVVKRHKIKKHQKKGQAPPPRKQAPPTQSTVVDATLDETFSDSESETFDPEHIHRLLEPQSKEKLISLILDSAALDPQIVSRVRALADRDVAHRKVFVHGLAWDATVEILRQIFSIFGLIEDCNVVVDKVSGRCKGFGFVLFQSRAGAIKALKKPQATLKGRVVNWQLASVGPMPSGRHVSGSVSPSVSDVSCRRINVSNVHADASPEKLRALFERFGEIEAGPLGFDTQTGKSRGFAVFVYKTLEGARKALEEPYKMFEGHRLHCLLRVDGSDKGKVMPTAAAAATSATVLGSVAQPPMLASVPTAQNQALLGQNPVYSPLLASNPLLAAAILNQASGLVNPAMNLLLSPALAGVPGFGVGAPSLYGSYTLPGVANQSSGLTYGSPWTSVGFQESQAGQLYQGKQMGQPVAGQANKGVIGGFSSFI